MPYSTATANKTLSRAEKDFGNIYASGKMPHGATCESTVMRLGRHWAFREPGIIPGQHYLWLASPAVVEEYSGRAIWRVELVQDALHVPVDGVDAQPEPQSDPLVGVSLGCKAEDFLLRGA